MAPYSTPAGNPGLAGPIPSSSRITAIVVDDEPLARQELVYLLEQCDGLEVLAQGTNGIEAVDLIRSFQPDLVFLDVQMPGLDGFAVLKKLLDKKIKLPQVVFATAFDQYAVRAFEVNAVDYLLKPSTAAAFVRRSRRRGLAWPHPLRHRSNRTATVASMPCSS